MSKIIVYTLRITLATLYDVYRGSYRRVLGDARLRWWSAKILSTVGLSYTVFNPADVKIQQGKRYIVMTNHSSLFDIPLTFLGLPGSIRMLTKQELFKIPIWGKGMRVAGFVPINRRDPRRALKDLDAARKSMESGIILWVAPEGTRSRTGKILPFKKGGFRLALSTGADIIPIGIRGAREVLPPGTWNIRMKQHAEIHIGTPIETANYTQKACGQLMADVEQQIRGLSNIPKAA